MAKISTQNNDAVFNFDKWLGLNENPDGDTQLKPGEASLMKNFKITRDGNLQKRPGMKTIHTARAWTGPIRGIWHGLVNDTEYTVFAADGDLWTYNFDTNTATSIKNAFTDFTDAPTTFFGYSGKLYIMNGHEYLEWDGSMPPQNGVFPVVGYRPLIATQTLPTGGGTELQRVNMLNGLRRVRFSPDGTATTFKLPEKGLTSIDYVITVATGADLPYSSSDLTNGTVTFASAPATGVDTIEIGYTYPATQRSTIEAMRFSEIYNGSTDNRVFVYGDDSNRAFYSDLDHDGQERADYFPDLNVVHVGSENTPITALIRHYSRLAVFKTDSAYSIDYGTITLASGAVTAAFYIVPTNRTIGNEAYGQTQLVNNSPRTLFGSAIYEWKNNASYSSNLTVDERQAKLVSKRVFNTLSSLELESAYAFDDNERQEYYVIQNGTALVHNYVTDAWYKYTGFDVALMFPIGGELYGCTSTGDIVHISRNYQNDNGAAIDCLWQSGALDFGRAWQRKYAAKIFVTIKPEVKANVQLTVTTNRKDDYAVKTIAAGFATFTDVNFNHFSFGLNQQPQTEKLKIKAKKFAYYHLIFQSNNDWSNATILAAQIKVRFMGDVK